ncbi:MAG: hypothetical protein KDC26_13095 [Armatimonadetes bacterium]|nr:hypothetical protein [Armatimonadota bacterium]
MPQALSAITGESWKKMKKLLNARLVKMGKAPLNNLGDGYNINDWLAVIEAPLGMSWTELTNFSGDNYEDRPSIGSFASECREDKDVHLVLCENDDRKETHVFAMCGNNIVDGYTGGKVTNISNTNVPSEYSKFRVKRDFLIWRD